jgi:hypothetical protein
MTVEVRYVRMTVDPALRAYWLWLDANPDREFSLEDYDLFAAGYRAERVPDDEDDDE